MVAAQMLTTRSPPIVHFPWSANRVSHVYVADTVQSALQPFHAYADGNLGWEPAFEVEAATVAVALRVWKEEPSLQPDAAMDRLRGAVTARIQVSAWLLPSLSELQHQTQSSAGVFTVCCACCRSSGRSTGALSLQPCWTSAAPPALAPGGSPTRSPPRA